MRVSLGDVVFITYKAAGFELQWLYLAMLDNLWSSYSRNVFPQYSHHLQRQI